MRNRKAWKIAWKWKRFIKKPLSCAKKYCTCLWWRIKNVFVIIQSASFGLYKIWICYSFRLKYLKMLIKKIIIKIFFIKNLISKQKINLECFLIFSFFEFVSKRELYFVKLMLMQINWNVLLTIFLFRRTNFYNLIKISFV